MVRYPGSTAKRNLRTSKGYVTYTETDINIKDSKANNLGIEQSNANDTVKKKLNYENKMF